MKKIGLHEKCPCNSGAKFKDCCIHNHKPRKGTLRLAYEIKGNDPFVARMFFQMTQLREHVFKTEERDSFDKKHHSVFQNLYEAKIAKEKCIDLMKDHREKVKNYDGVTYSNDGLLTVNKPIDNELNMLFKDFFIRGNIALKALVKLCGIMGYNMSFAFTDDKKFEDKKKKFLKNHPEPEFIQFCNSIEDMREKWYKIFIFIRNKIEHDGFTLPEVTYLLGKTDNIKVFYPTLNNQSLNEILKICWENLFQITEEMIIFSFSKKLPSPLVIVEIPETKRDLGNPIRYVVSIQGLQNGPKL
ncbi:MAG: SEC-C domain-containing protein [bacterium]|nr:SEC-C domain-containing protein [bacterium]